MFHVKQIHVNKIHYKYQYSLTTLSILFRFKCLKSNKVAVGVNPGRFDAWATVLGFTSFKDIFYFI